MKLDRKLFVIGLALVGAAGTVVAQQARIDDYHRSLQKKIAGLMVQGQSSIVNVNDSNDGDGKDAEIKLTMSIQEFEAFAPVAALEAAAIPHKFKAVYIYLRHDPTGRVGRIAFKDAEPLAAMFLAGEKVEATERMKSKFIWH
jgi:hypothetical protein